jgi:hypothetical protein
MVMNVGDASCWSTNSSGLLLLNGFYGTVNASASGCGTIMNASGSSSASVSSSSITLNVSANASLTVDFPVDLFAAANSTEGEAHMHPVAYFTVPCKSGYSFSFTETMSGFNVIESQPYEAAATPYISAGVEGINGFIIPVGTQSYSITGIIPAGSYVIELFADATVYLNGPMSGLSESFNTSASGSVTFTLTPLP